MSAAPRVLRVITRLNIGGPARQALLLSRGLVPEYETTLAAGTPAASEGELLDPAVPVTRLPLIRPLRPATDARALAAARGLIAAQRPAVVHTHMAKAGTVARTAALTMRRRPRTVHTFHGHVLDGYFGSATQRAFIEVERRLARRTDVLVAVSPEVRDELLGMGIGEPGRFRVVPLGLDLRPFLAVGEPTGSFRARLGLVREAPLIGAIGRLVPIKDHGTLLDALTRLPGVHLAVIGDGELRGELERLVLDRGLAGRVHFTGWADDLPAAVADLDAVVLTSRNEGTPVALIEASAAGRPVVATDVGGVRSVVGDGVTGWLTPAGDARAVAERVRQLLDDAEAARRMGEAGREHVRTRFDAPRLLHDVRALYDELLDAEVSAPRRGRARAR